MPSDAPREADLSIGGQPVDQAARAAEANMTVETVPTADEVVEELRGQLDEMDRRGKEKDAELAAAGHRASEAERARQDAENRARAATDAAANAERVAGRSVEEARLDAIKNALGTHEGHLKNLAAQKANALSEGDFTKASEFDAEMAKVGGRIAQLEAGRDELDLRIKEPLPDAGRQPDQRQTRQDGPEAQREAFIRNQPPRIQDWLRSDKGARYFTDSAFATKVAAAASFAQNIKGLQIDSQAYLDYVEEQVGLRAPSDQGQQPQARDDRRPSTPGQGREPDAGQRMTTAPAGGASDGSIRRNANGTIEVYLTQEEKQQAARDGVSEVEWARHKRDLIREGRIGPGAVR